GHLGGMEWQALTPDARSTWLVPKHMEEFESLIAIGSREAKLDRARDAGAIFKQYGRGIATNADPYVYDYANSVLASRAQQMVENFNSELDRWKRNGQPEQLEGFLRVDEHIHKWIRNTKRTLRRGAYAVFREDRIRRVLYRPFNKRFHFFDRAFNEDTYKFPRIFPTAVVEEENRVIALTDLGSERPFMLL